MKNCNISNQTLFEHLKGFKLKLHAVKLSKTILHCKDILTWDLELGRLIIGTFSMKPHNPKCRGVGRGAAG